MKKQKNVIILGKKVNMQKKFVIQHVQQKRLVAKKKNMIVRFGEWLKKVMKVVDTTVHQQQEMEAVCMKNVLMKKEKNLQNIWQKIT